MTHTPQPTQGDLAAGRALDTLVATKVMGWHLVPSKSFGPRGWATWDDSNGNAQAAGVGGGFKPSTDISAAWQVFEMVLVRVGTASIVADMEDWGRGAITSSTGPERVVTVTIGEWTVRAPVCEAICRAALTAISG